LVIIDQLIIIKGPTLITVRCWPPPTLANYIKSFFSNSNFHLKF
jgi:hypothetical protein